MENIIYATGKEGKNVKKNITKLISIVVTIMLGVVAGGAIVGNRFTKKIAKMKETAAKVHALYMTYDQWLHIHQEGKTLADYFTRNGYKTIAIYGMKELGERLYDELKGSGVLVSYSIDKNADEVYAEVDVVKPDEDFESVDAIVVTAVYYFDVIEEMLSKKVDYPIISLEDIVYDI